jgi:spore coat protein U-like protein
MIRRLALASALFVAVGSAAPSMAVADSNTSNLDISASVQNNCTISAAALSFGTYSPAASKSVTGTVKTNCTVNANAVITLSQGNNSATGSSDELPLRRLKNGGSDNYLNYNLYKDNGKTMIWPNSDSNGNALGIYGYGTEQSTSVYGEIPAGQTAPAGDYSDTVTATVTY